MKNYKPFSLFRLVSEKTTNGYRKELILKTPSNFLIGFVATLVCIAIVVVAYVTFFR